VRELKALRTAAINLPSMKISDRVPLDLRLPFPVTVSEIGAEFDLQSMDADRFGIELSNSRGETYRIGYDRQENEYFSDRRRAGDSSFSDNFSDRVHRARRIGDGGTIRMHLVLDVASVELFADGGATVMTDIFFPTEEFDRVSLFADGGEVKLLRGEVHRLESIWRDQTAPGRISGRGNTHISRPGQE